MKDDGYLSLADVVQMMLVMEGTGALRNESRLVAACMDYMDPDARELRVVERHCNASLLAPYIEAADAAAPDLGAAAGQAAAYLYGECVVDEGVAHSVADGIAEGVARWRGIAWGERPRGASAGRVSSVVGIYVDSKDSLHVAALRVGVGLTHMSVTTGVTEWADANRCLARILGRGDGGRFDALVAASDLSLTRYLGVRGLLRDAGVNVRRWMLPTDA